MFEILCLILAGSVSNYILFEEKDTFETMRFFLFLEPSLFFTKLCFSEYKSRTKNLVLIYPDDYIKRYILVSTTIMEELISLSKHSMKTNANSHNNAAY